MKKLIVILFSMVGTIILIYSFFYSNITGMFASLLFYGVAVLEEKTNLLVVRITSFTIITMALLVSLAFVFTHIEDIHKELMWFKVYENWYSDLPTDEELLRMSDEEFNDYYDSVRNK